MSTHIALLLERLTNAQRFIADADQEGNRDKAVAGKIVLEDLLDNATLEGLLRDALRAATAPTGGPAPIPVTLGAQDAAAATVGVDELMALAGLYMEAGVAYHRGQIRDREFQQAFQQLRTAAERLAMAAFVVNVDRAHHEGRLS